MLLEVIACSVNDALEAERGGAGRLEVVRELGKGGLTPTLELVEEIANVVRIPVRVMIREREGYTAGGAEAVEQLARLAAGCATLGVDGIVMGFLRDSRIDEATMKSVLAAATPARVTFHHAFDDLPDPIATMHTLAAMAADRSCAHIRGARRLGDEGRADVGVDDRRGAAHSIARRRRGEPGGAEDPGESRRR